MTTGDACSPQTRAWLQELVAHDTVSGTRSNIALVERVRGFLEPLGFDIRITRSADGQRANLLASLGGRDGGLLLAGHTDVVPVDGQRWTRPPFELTEDAERFYGRGVCDMKGFLAALLAVVERLGPSGLAKPLHLALTFDEEIGCLGVRELLDDLVTAGVQPSACVVGEPTGMGVVRAHKGRQAWRCRVHGQAAHSSLSGTVVNAAETACQLVSDINRRAEALPDIARDDGFAVPFSTMATCRIQAGQATNVIPETAEFDFDLRHLPQQDPEEVLAPIRASAEALEGSMRTRYPDSQVQLQRRTSVPALVAGGATDELVERLIDAGLTVGPHVAFTTEGGLYQARGIPTVICGPGDIAQAHTADEFILKSQLTACETLLRRLLSAARA